MDKLTALVMFSNSELPHVEAVLKERKPGGAVRYFAHRQCFIDMSLKPMVHASHWREMLNQYTPTLCEAPNTENWRSCWLCRKALWTS